jgi:hypothetical protein
MSTPTQQRDEVARVASSDVARALFVGREIDDSWFRCQALAIAAIFLPMAERMPVIDEAFEAAAKLREPNPSVTVASWPLKALALCGYSSRVQSEGARLLLLISEEPSPVRRADALRFLLGATASSQQPIAANIAESFGAACLEPLANGKRNKKGAYLLEEAIPVIARLDSELATALVSQLPPLRAGRARLAIDATRGQQVEQFYPWPNLGALPNRLQPSSGEPG